MSDRHFNEIRREIESTLGYRFDDAELLRDALYAAAPTARLPEANKTLAQLGDLAFRVLVGTNCFNRDCGKMATSDQLQSVGSNAHFAQIGRAQYLHNYVVLQNGCVGGVSDGLMATALKAILGAVWQDSKANLQTLAKVCQDVGLGTFAIFK